MTAEPPITSVATFSTRGVERVAVRRVVDLAEHEDAASVPALPARTARTAVTAVTAVAADASELAVVAIAALATRSTISTVAALTTFAAFSSLRVKLHGAIDDVRLEEDGASIATNPSRST